MPAIERAESSSSIIRELKVTSDAVDHAGALSGESSILTVTLRNVNAELTRPKNCVNRSSLWRFNSASASCSLCSLIEPDSHILIASS